MANKMTPTQTVVGFSARSLLASGRPVSEPRVVATGPNTQFASYFGIECLDPVATARGSDRPALRARLPYRQNGTLRDR